MQLHSVVAATTKTPTGKQQSNVPARSSELCKSTVALCENILDNLDHIFDVFPTGPEQTDLPLHHGIAFEQLGGPVSCSIDHAVAALGDLFANRVTLLKGRRLGPAVVARRIIRPRIVVVVVVVDIVAAY
jgi:hypothetical protein